jgi:hypothetical protein
MVRTPVLDEATYGAEFRQASSFTLHKLRRLVAT